MWTQDQPPELYLLEGCYLKKRGLPLPSKNGIMEKITSQPGNPFRKRSATNTECRMAWAPPHQSRKYGPRGAGSGGEQGGISSRGVSSHRADGSWLISFRVLRMPRLMPCGFKACFSSDANERQRCRKTERERKREKGRGLGSEVHDSTASPGPNRATPEKGQRREGAFPSSRISSREGS